VGGATFLEVLLAEGGVLAAEAGAIAAVAAPPVAVAAVGTAATYGAYEFSDAVIAPFIDKATFNALQWWEEFSFFSDGKAGKTVNEILKDKRGSIKDAPLPKGCPDWRELGNMTWEQIEAAARAGNPGYKTIKKLLGDKRFDKP
jgi:hypothetical protein